MRTIAEAFCLIKSEREMLNRCSENKPHSGYEAQGSGLHNAYLRDVPVLLATIRQLRIERKQMEE